MPGAWRWVTSGGSSDWSLLLRAALLGAGMTAVKGDFSKRNDMIAAMEKTRDRQPARRVHAWQVAQSGAGQLLAQGGRQGEQDGRRGREGVGRSGPRVPDVTRASSHQYPEQRKEGCA